ncbi:hypothetical protein AYO22_11250 [Fonsecaea multimorphosa]|nr:hypothetical protein AYO22_11250 [Fonsecaea multimorphosa]
METIRMGIPRAASGIIPEYALCGIEARGVMEWWKPFRQAFPGVRSLPNKKEKQPRKKYTPEDVIFREDFLAREFDMAISTEHTAALKKSSDAKAMPTAQQTVSGPGDVAETAEGIVLAAQHITQTSKLSIESQCITQCA